MRNTLVKRALASIIFFLSPIMVSAGAVKEDANQVLDSIVPVPGVHIKVVQAMDALTTGKKITTVYQQPLTPLRASPGPHATVNKGSLSRSNTRSASSVFGAMHRQAAAAARIDGVASPDAMGQGYENITADYGMQYSLPVTINNVTRQLALDTASADFWAVATGFDCVDWDRKEVDPSECLFGAPFPAGPLGHTFPVNRSLPNLVLNVRYPDGELVFGEIGLVDVKVGGVSVRSQQMGLVTYAIWWGNNITSGVLGLGYPSLGHVYGGKNSSSGSYTRYSSPTVFNNMVAQGKVEDPLFGIALARNASDGVISWGGMPDVPGLDYASQTIVPILIVELNNDPETADTPSFYTIVPDGVNYGFSTDTAKHPYVIDTGTTLMYMPSRLAEAVNSAFVPPAAYDPDLGAYYTDCSATPPPMYIDINKVPFVVNPVDMILRDHPDPLTGLCMTAVTSGGSGPYILGETFLTNVAVGFDIGAAEITLISRAFY